MSVNLTNIELILLKLIEKTNSNLELLAYSKAIEQLKNNLISVVFNFDNLPDPNSVPNGSLFLVKNEKLFYMSNHEYKSWKALKSDNLNYLWAWGTGSFGQLGNNCISNFSSPVSVVGGFTDWCAVSAGFYHSIGLRTNGTLWSWGSPASGQLGSYSTGNQFSPVSVVGGFTDWCAVSAGRQISSAIRTNGTLWSWGYGSQLGDGYAVTRSSPVSVVGGFTDWCAVSNQYRHTAALRTNGTLWSWGLGGSGRLGDGYAVNRSSPVSVVGGFTDWCAVSVGFLHTAALRTNGTLWTWGSNSNGQLGDGFAVSSSSPVSVVGGFTDWCAVSLAGTNTAALRTNGSLWTWGAGSFGQLGDNCNLNRSSPVSVVGGFTDWCLVSVSPCHTAALRTNSTLWSWGVASQGQLGDGYAVCRSSPVSVVGGFTDWSTVTTNSGFTLAIRTITL